MTCIKLRFRCKITATYAHTQYANVAKNSTHVSLQQIVHILQHF